MADAVNTSPDLFAQVQQVAPTVATFLTAKTARLTASMTSHDVTGGYGRFVTANKGKTMVKAIDTIYNGYKFRSRLEARWAVYLDTIGISYEYEKEGYDLDGVLYLPDFWLPQVNMFAEVKAEQLTEAELHKVKLLVEATKKACILLVGLPAEQSYPIVWITEEGEIEIGEPGYGDVVLSMYHHYPINEHRFYTSTGGTTADDFSKNGMFDDVPNAVQAAKSARFESARFEFDQFNQSRKGTRWNGK